MKDVPALAGPPNDVIALRDVLIKHWGFSSHHITTLLNQDATKRRILEELQLLTKKTQANDHIFIYYSGHGTSAKDQANKIPLPHTSGALLPTDFSAASAAEMEASSNRWPT